MKRSMDSKDKESCHGHLLILKITKRHMKGAGQSNFSRTHYSIQLSQYLLSSCYILTLRMEPGTQRYTTQTANGDRYLDNSKWTGKSPWQRRSRLLWEHSRETYNPGLGNQGRLCKYKPYMYVLIPTVWQTKVRLTKRLSKLPKITCPISGWAGISPKVCLAL